MRGLNVEQPKVTRSWREPPSREVVPIARSQSRGLRGMSSPLSLLHVNILLGTAE